MLRELMVVEKEDQSGHHHYPSLAEKGDSQEPLYAQ